MRKLLILAALLTCCVWTDLFEPKNAQAQTGTCTVNCPGGATLRCCLTTGTCTSVPGSSINCGGTTMSCGPADQYHACVAVCAENRDACLETCIKCRGCVFGYNLCVSNCGPAPTTNIGC
jgi:hypothetical protein